jgi:hypothetical protein
MVSWGSAPVVRNTFKCNAENWPLTISREWIQTMVYKLHGKLIKLYTMKAYGRVNVYVHIFLTSALAVGEWSASHPRRFTRRGNSPWYPLDRRLSGPQSQTGRRGENSWHHQDLNSDPFVIQPITSCYTHFAIPAPQVTWCTKNFKTLLVWFINNSMHKALQTLNMAINFKLRTSMFHFTSGQNFLQHFITGQ